MPHADPPKKRVANPTEEQAAHDAAKKPGPGDVHEQRQDGQKGEGVVQKGPRAPTQSLIDEERGDWEGMGQSRHQPE